MIENKRLKSLQALRGLAFLGIFTSHIYVTQLGAWGVSIFFVLSGFVMFYSYNTREIKCSVTDNFCFAKIKIKKLYPLHIVMMLFSMLYVIYYLLEKFSFANLIYDLFDIVLNVFLVQAWFPIFCTKSYLNAVAWYLSVSCFLYYMFPWIMRKTRSHKNNVDALKSIFFVIFLQVIVALVCFKIRAIGNVVIDCKWITYVCPVYRLGDFVIGMNMGYIYKQTKGKLGGGTASFIEICLCINLIILQCMYRGQIASDIIGLIRYSLLYILSSMLTVYMFAINKGIVTRLASNKLIVELGNVSPYAFLIHQMVIRYYDTFVRRIYPPAMNIYIKGCCCLVITIFLSMGWKKIIRKYEGKNVF